MGKIEAVASGIGMPAVIIHESCYSDRLSKDVGEIQALHGKTCAGILRWVYAGDAHRNIEIQGLHVEPSYRRCGIASKLIQELLCRYPEATWVSCWTLAEMEEDGSWGVYLKNGFDQKCLLPDYYGIGIPCRYFARRGG